MEPGPSGVKGMTSAPYGTMLQGAERSLHRVRESSHSCGTISERVERRLQPLAKFPKILHVFVRLLVPGAEMRSSCMQCVLRFTNSLLWP